MKYSKEFHEKLKAELTGREEYAQVVIVIGAISTLLDEIERLQAERRWIPFSEQRPPEDETRYKVIRIKGVSYWTRLPEPPEVTE